MPKSYTPNWFFTALLDNHINQMMARYSCLRALRMDFFYRKDTPDFLQPDHRWLELQLRMLLEQVEQFENIVIIDHHRRGEDSFPTPFTDHDVPLSAV